MARHKGSGCEGQAGLRREEEGSASLMDKFFGLAASAVGIGIPAGIAIECYSRLLDDVDFLREEEPAIEEHIHKESVPYVHTGDSDSSYSAGGSMDNGGSNDDVIIIQGRVKIAIGEFRSKHLEDEPLIGDLIGKIIQKNVVEYLNGFEGMTAEKLDDVISSSPYTKEEIDKKPERLYKIPGLNAVLEGNYDAGDPEDDIDGDMSITISSKHAYWDNGNTFDVRRYSVSDFMSKLETLCSCLAKKVVGKHASPSTTPFGGFVFVAFWLAVSR